MLKREEGYTVFEYLYRDAGNYKAWGSVLLSGRATAEDEAALRSRMDSGAFFVAEKVGVPSLQRELWKWSDGPTEDDHGFHEFHGFREATQDDLANFACSKEEFFNRFVNLIQ